MTVNRHDDGSGAARGVFDGQWRGGGPELTVISPIDGEVVGRVVTADASDAKRVVAAAYAAFLEWRTVPAPIRAEVVRRLVSDPQVALVSYTGSVATGRRVGARVQERFGRPLLELGGNNAVIVTPSADLEAAVEAVLFGAVGTTGQRCTSTRRLLLHESIHDRFVERLVELYPRIPVGDPREEGVLVGPLVDRESVRTMQLALEAATAQGGRILVGGRPLDRAGGCYVAPCLVAADPKMPIVREETFAPILYVMRYRTIDEAIAIHNDVPQGLSSAIFSNDLSECERFLSATGSDCGLANVNTSTSGAEIGGAFGGEKETGGGRESGSDSWKAYMRRQTSVINASGRIALAQGVRFTLGEAQGAATKGGAR